MKIQKSHRELEKNNVFSKLKFELKDPNEFKEMLGLKKAQTGMHQRDNRMMREGKFISHQ